MRISDWSSDVCSSDLYGIEHQGFGGLKNLHIVLILAGGFDHIDQFRAAIHACFPNIAIGIGKRMDGIVPLDRRGIGMKHLCHLDNGDTGASSEGFESRTELALNVGSISVRGRGRWEG